MRAVSGSFSRSRSHADSEFNAHHARSLVLLGLLTHARPTHRVATPSRPTISCSAWNQSRGAPYADREAAQRRENVASQSIDMAVAEAVHKQHDAENPRDVDSRASQRPAAHHDSSHGCWRLRLATRPAPFVLPPGAHLATPRRGYIHHGIYTGNGKVVHYAGLLRSPPFGCVEEVPLERFAGGHEVIVVTNPAPRFPADEIVRRAHARLGETRYNLVSNNCEHLCAWCVVGASYSEQVERLRAWFDRLARIARMVVWPLRRLRPKERLEGASLPLRGCGAQLRKTLIVDEDSRCA